MDYLYIQADKLCLPACKDNPHALVCGLSPIQVVETMVSLLSQESINLFYFRCVMPHLDALEA